MKNFRTGLVKVAGKFDWKAEEDRRSYLAAADDPTINDYRYDVHEKLKNRRNLFAALGIAGLAGGIAGKHPLLGIGGAIAGLKALGANRDVADYAYDAHPYSRRKENLEEFMRTNGPDARVSRPLTAQLGLVGTRSEPDFLQRLMMQEAMLKRREAMADEDDAPRTPSGFPIGRMHDIGTPVKTHGPYPSYMTGYYR